MNERLGRGINMGNSFEAPSETEWGNPWKPEYFRIISELGFNHVRVPIRWEPPQRSLATAPYTIQPEFLARIKEVVDAALENNLHIIINMHHHDALFADPATEKERFLSQWSQIATYFRDYPDTLLFEVLNEPHGNITVSMWNEYFADALAEIRKTNPTRIVLMGVAEYGGLGAIGQLALPADEYIIVSPHYYSPFTFTHQGAEWVSGADAWLGTEWLDTEADRQAVESDFNYALQFSQNNHIPIHVGEFGAYSKAGMESRVRWTTFLARWFEENGLSWAYWEFSAGFGIYNPATKQHVTFLVDALLHNEMPPATPVFATSVYGSDFTAGADGWTLQQQGTAAGNLSVASANLEVSVSSGGTESWHLQLIRNNIPLEKDKLYRIAFTAKAQADRSITFYAGRASSPWNAYSAANATTLSTTEASYTSTFVMTTASDPVARLVFDLGKSVTAVTISSVQVEELSLDPVTVGSVSPPESNLLIYPNPVRSALMIAGMQSDYDHVELIDSKGVVQKYGTIIRGNAWLDLEFLPAGLYILRLAGKGRFFNMKVVKK